VNSPEFIDSPELYNIYEKMELYVMSNYPTCTITVNSKSVSFGFPNEFARIFLYQSKDKDYLAVKITQDLTKAMSSNNGLIYKVKTIDDFQYLKSAIKVILECRVPKFIVETPVPEVEESLPAEPNEEAAPDESIVQRFKNLLGGKR
jgi:hypothetical protein